ncbi:MAG: hypothetical protein Q8921_15150 [Bacteroidota bacterium]|nr:hypothetical protein [Bacteroidota bacterium]
MHSAIALPLVVALLVRLAAFPLAHLGKSDTLWNWEYAAIALNIAAGKGYSSNWNYPGLSHTLTLPTAYMPPGQVVIHLLALGPFGDTLAGQIALFLEEVLLGGVFVFAMWKVLSLLFGAMSRTTRLGVWLAALYPSFIAASTTLGVTSGVLALDALFLWIFVLAIDKLRTGNRGNAKFIGAGVLGGLIAQFRSEAYLLMALSFVLVLWVNRFWVRRLAPALGFAVLGAAVVCSPWIIRNYVVFHRPIITSTNGGFNFWRGHSAEATGSAYINDRVAVWTTDATWRQIEPTGAVDSNVEFRQDSFLWSDARQWIRDHPLIEAKRSFLKLFNFLVIDWRNPQARYLPYLIVYFATVFAAIVGIVRVRREHISRNLVVRDALALMLLWVVFYTCVAVVFFPMPRIQVILTGFYFPIVVYGAEDIFDWARKNLLRKIPTND